MLEGILPVLDATLPGRDCWTFGGGTALAVQLGHRVSYDIDIFLESSRHLRALAPPKNEAVRAFLAGRSYQWPGHYLKLELDGGEIDFIASAPVTDLSPKPLVVGDGTTIQMELILEIAAKKAFYRASDFKTRDVFDFAAIAENDRAGLIGILRDLPSDRLPRLRDRLTALTSAYVQLAERDVNPTPDGLRFLGDTAISAVLEVVEEAART